VIKDNFADSGEPKDNLSNVLKELRILYLKDPQLFNSEIVKNKWLSLFRYILMVIVFIGSTSESKPIQNMNYFAFLLE
jgi:hypothetical protein